MAKDQIKKLKGAEDFAVNPEEAIKKPDDTARLVGRLMGYMTSGEARPKFILAMALRILALLGLVAAAGADGSGH